MPSSSTRRSPGTPSDSAASARCPCRSTGAVRVLKERVLTALILLPLALGIILFAPLGLFDVAMVAVVFLLGREYFALCAISRPTQWLFLAATAGLLIAIFVDLLPGSGDWVLLLAVILWLLMPLWFVRRPVLPGGIKAATGVVLLLATGIALH